ncbi:MAG: enoyl-CoA hydratase/isomerase family protein [Alicyclobacillus sp.]|nr:enoyl-CoA hydratase/isomerase family protein [Alicyclobacillus sp.]
MLVQREHHVAIILLNRPKQRNAFTLEMVDEWAGALATLQEDEAVRVVVVTGVGSAFCAGGDLAMLSDGLGNDSVTRKNELWAHIHQVAFQLERMDKPVIAAINGAAVGAGLDMALLCDLRFAADTARLSTGYVRIGLFPGDGATYLLPRVVGLSKALELLWTGDVLDAQEALRLGLVDRVYSSGTLMEETLRFAHRLAEGPMLAIRMMKRAVYQSRYLDLRTAFDMISSHYSVIRDTEDHREGLAAAMERRTPRFQGR